MQSKRPPEYSDGLFCPLAFCSARRRSDTNHRRPGGAPAGSPSPKAPPASCRNGFPGARISGLRSSVRLFSCICLHIRTQCIRIHVPHTLFLPPSDLQNSVPKKKADPGGGVGRLRRRREKRRIPPVAGAGIMPSAARSDRAGQRPARLYIITPSRTFRAAV